MDPTLPAFVGSYHSLVPLEGVPGPGPAPPPALGIPSRVFHAVSADTGAPVALRRLDPRHLTPTPDLLSRYGGALARWRGVGAHPFLARWLDVFVSAELDGVPALWLAHEFVPGAVTLEDAWLRGGAPPGLKESALWPLLTQLAAALRAAHGAGLVLWGSGLCPAKILVSDAGRPLSARLRLSCPGALDPLMEHHRQGQEALARLRRADLGALGQTLLAAACCGARRPLGVEALAGAVTPALARCIAGLLAAPREGEGFPDAGALAAAVADRALDSLADAQRRSDLLMTELGKECENGRLLRLLARLGTIVGRPGLGADAEWAETGDRYLLKLFYSFLLHQTDERGSPVLDWGVLAEALNKFDAGVPEQVR